jgi:hypothetical protein
MLFLPVVDVAVHLLQTHVGAQHDVTTSHWALVM